uniref:oligopeptide/dipeptide ABC transporter ATP-binding protein n=1 Tax=Ndongobacter massiliensis TaxID=1871025 RepID=UPI00092FE7FA|nr:oligopeptide/dipeptide ABC transporter ATP-binding protein [Ndongobacter massiliensis]
METKTEVAEKKLLFSIKNLKKYFPLKRKFLQRRQFYVHANENISLDIYEGETLGLVGESGCGKSTFGRTILQIYEQTEGVTLYYGSSLAEVNPDYVQKDLRQLPKLFAGYQKATQAYEELAARREKAPEGDEAHALDDAMMKERRRIQNEYYNILRLAGGLLVDHDLTAVGTLLSDAFSARVKKAQILRRLQDIEHQLERPEFAKEHAALAEQKKKLEEELPQAEVVAREKEAAVQARREANRANPDFAKFDAYLDDGVDLARLTEPEMRALRKDMQIIFQDPYSSLDTRMTVGNIIGEGIIAHEMFSSRKVEGYNEYVQNVMQECGLAPYFIHRYPHQFSGGQRQRIGIARALALEPKFIVCDEAVSALDVSIQSQIINLLQDLKRDKNLTYLFITHDLSVVKYISDRIAVMYLGMVVELTDSEKLFATPLHPYTSALLAAIPRTDVDSDQALGVLEGDIPSAVNPPSGCRFHTRCKYCMERCKAYEPALQEVQPGHFVACHLMDLSDEERASWKLEAEANEKRHLQELEAQSRQANEQLLGGTEV